MMTKPNNTRPSVVAMAVCAVLFASISGCNNDDNKSSSSTPVKDNAYYKAMAESLVSKMTTEEQLNMLAGPGYSLTSAGFGVNYDALVNLKSDVPGTVGYINGVYNAATGIDIAATKLADGPAGVRINSTRSGESGTFYGTAFPVGILLGSTWNPELVQEVGKAIGNEVKEYGLDFWLAPGMNIQRNPLNGRNFEYFSEDPLISGVMAAAEVNGAQAEGVGTTIKHFIANNGETSRNIVNNVISPRAIREIYLRGYEYAAEHAHPWAVMTAMNKVNSTYTGQWKDLNTSVLRNEWGYEGFVMSDWFSGDGSYVDMIKSGNDLIEPGGRGLPYGFGDALTALKEGYSSGILSSGDIKQSTVRILTQVLKTPSNQNYIPDNNPDLNMHAILSKEAAKEGMVLLKNTDNSLPISRSDKVAPFGIAAVNTLKGGGGSGDVNAAYTINIMKGLSSQFAIDSTLDNFYNDFFAANKTSTNFGGISTIISCREPDSTEMTLEQINTAADNNDVAVISIGRNSSQGVDRTNTAGDYLLSAAESELINNVSTAFHNQNKKVIVVLNTAGVMDTTAWQDKVDGILLAYMPGQEAGDAIAEILSGDTNPSGKLTQTFPASYVDVPSSGTFPGVDTNGDGRVDTNYYNDDIYVGYRYYNSFNKPVAYPFGYGLSYTTFSISDSAVSANTLDKGANGSITLTATVSNTGSIAGKEVAQVYINAPEVKLKKPTIELKAFDKTSELDAGASEKLSFNIPAKLLASFDPDNNQWIVEPGTYQAYISNSSDISGVEPVSFTVSKEIVVSNTTPGALALPSGVAASDFVTVSE